MRNSTKAIAPAAPVTAIAIRDADAAAIAAKSAKLAATRTAKPSKPAAAKPAKPAATVAPSVPASDATSDRTAERIAARDAVSTYYNGRSLPFKSASDTFAAFRTDKAPKAPTTRQAALLAAMLISGDNVQPNGQFKRGGFVFDGRNVQPETGCLSDMHGRTVSHVSGPLAGKLARDAIFAIDLPKARAEISANIGDAIGKLAIARIDALLAA